MYASTKKSNEVTAFFSMYGRWGPADKAYFGSRHEWFMGILMRLQDLQVRQ